MTVPDFVTHYHVADRRPFLNLSDLGAPEIEQVLADLQQRRSTGHQRVFGRRYMELRRMTEHKLRTLFVESGGSPARRAPHYFVLGSSMWFEGLSPNTRAVVLPLSELPSDVTSVTYPDSFTAMALGPRFGLPYEARPYHERAIRLEELEDVISEHGLPRDEQPLDYTGYAHRAFESYVEVQLWSDEPLRKYLDGGHDPGQLGVDDCT